MNTLKYKVSVIIPVYNAESTLKTSINSVINQSIGFENIELIIVNDKSTDNSKNIIDEYCNRYKNIIGIHLDKNSGFPGKPRNIGIERATAPYIIFLDADDEYFQHAFEVYYKTIIKENSDFVMGSHYWNLDNDKVKITILHECDDKSDLININPLLNEKTFNMTTYYNVAPWGKIFRKQLIMDKNIRFLEDSLSEDAYFYYKTLLNSKRITLLPNEILYNYNVFESKDSIIHTHNLETYNNFLKGFKEVINLFDDCPYGCKHPIRASMHSLLLLFSNLNLNDKKENIEKLYEFEKSINHEIYMPIKELKIMNDQILKHHFTRAIIISEIYSKLYNNATIKKLYRKYR